MAVRGREGAGALALVPVLVSGFPVLASGLVHWTWRWFLPSVEKGIWWMPWRVEAMKDVARCDKPRGAVSRL